MYNITTESKITPIYDNMNKNRVKFGVIVWARHWDRVRVRARVKIRARVRVRLELRLELE
jgi:hypothetical protein